MSLTYKNIIEELIKAVPEYEKSEHYSEADTEFVSSVYAGFADFLLGKLKNYSENEEVVNKSFVFINQMFSSGDDEVSNVACVEILEVIAGSKHAIEIAEKLLNKDGLHWLNKNKEWINAE